MSPGAPGWASWKLQFEPTWGSGGSTRSRTFPVAPSKTNIRPTLAKLEALTTWSSMPSEFVSPGLWTAIPKEPQADVQESPLAAVRSTVGTSSVRTSAPVAPLNMNAWPMFL